MASATSHQVSDDVNQNVNQLNAKHPEGLNSEIFWSVPSVVGA